MSFDPISAVFGVAEKVIERVWPDPAQRAEALLNMKNLEQRGDLAFLEADLKVLTGQLEINRMEAQHGGNFKGGWRPFCGWVCGIALAYKFILYPFLVFALQVTAFYADAQLFPMEYLPVIEWMELSVILTGMLGLGSFRSFEKRKTQMGDQ
ncbi:holin family protein [Kiloniella laminariae]|uniref:Holin family protein n=1 Tax=Kiloniella laminariae TaxID=454162 RepID=A0ABT4LKS5_9PROT|nr:holin family protein [Kiloniella laminariae]MCZ4281710.1 holin family protein [Kiloniella laminariae]